MPALVADDGAVLTQRSRSAEYLTMTPGDTPLLPKDAVDRAHVRALRLPWQTMHPVQPTCASAQLHQRYELGATNEQKNAWIDDAQLVV